jgi:hypothetical protein
MRPAFYGLMRLQWSFKSKKFFVGMEIDLELHRVARSIQ